MKSIRSHAMAIISTIIWIAAAIGIIIFARMYFTFISQHIYAEGSAHVSEVYMQVDKSFDAFLNQTWRNLDDWYQLIASEEADKVKSEIDSRKKTWEFSDFFFLNESYKYMSLDGVGGDLTPDDDLKHLFGEKANTIDGQLLPDGTHLTLLAISVPEGTFNGFKYQAIAVSYTNNDIINSLDTDAFARKSTCFVLKNNGDVLLSTQQGGSIFTNYLTYLIGGSSLSEQQISDLKQDWQQRKSGIITCKIGKESYYLSYLPINYRDYMLLGVVPESAVSGSLLEIQKATIDFAVKVSLTIGAALIFQIVLRYRSRVRKAALDLKYRDLMFSTLSDNVDDISIMLDGITWKADYVSSNIERLLGITPEELKNNIRCMEPDNSKDSLLTAENLRKIPSGDCLTFERDHFNVKTGEHHWYHESIYHEIIDGTDKYFIIMSDRTDDKKMSENLRGALDAAKNANLAKSEFLSNMSHDIRTPMNAILGFTELMDINADDSVKVREYIGKIESSGQHLLRLINDVLDMSKIESGNVSINDADFSLLEMLQDLKDIISPQAKAKAQNFSIEKIGEIVDVVCGDRLRVYQILINLLSNAVKYTPEHGEINMTVEQVHGTSSKIKTLNFTVWDNGVGMSQEFLENLFDPFTREKRSTINSIQGTGLGMAITKNLIDLMGGSIDVKSEIGKGTTIKVSLSFTVPDEDITQATQEEAIPINEDALRGLNILVAEDNDLSAEMLLERLEIEGASPVRVVDGEKAVAEFTSSKPGTYDLILMDVEMPNMNGHEATKTIRNSEHPEANKIPIFAMTANVFSDDIKKAIDAGMNVHLAKPVEIDKLKSNVDKFLEDDSK